jgi:hypothetical protein
MVSDAGFSAVAVEVKASVKPTNRKPISKNNPNLFIATLL